MSRTWLKLLVTTLPLSALALTAGLGATVALPFEHEPGHAPDAESSSSRFVEQVRDATAEFRDVNQATGYTQFGGCVSGPEEGAMGVHFVNPTFLFDGGKLDVNEPEALIYEFKDGRARLVGVEYIVVASEWDAAHRDPAVPPVLGEQLFHFNDSPNRFRLPPFYELHVWAWRDNPSGAFVDWNPLVSCEGQ